MDDQRTDRAGGRMLSVGDLSGTWHTEKASGLNETILLRPDGSGVIEFYNVGLFAREHFHWEITDAGTKLTLNPPPPGWVESVFKADLYHDEQGRRVMRLAEGDEFFFKPAEK
jgi:hypothetical protein